MEWRGGNLGTSTGMAVRGRDRGMRRFGSRDFNREMVPRGFLGFFNEAIEAVGTMGVKLTADGSVNGGRILALPRSAEFDSAVSPSSIRQTLRNV